MTVGTLLRHTWVLAESSGHRATVALLVLTLIGMVFDLVPDISLIWLVPFGLVTFYTQFRVTAGLLGELGFVKGGSAGFITFLVLSLVMTFAVVAGLILLVVPGIILLVRWSIAVPILMAEHAATKGALTESWRRTKGKSWPLYWAWLIYGLIVIPASIAAEYASSLQSVPISLLANLLFSGSTFLLWHLSVAAYIQLTHAAGTTTLEPA